MTVPAGAVPDRPAPPALQRVVVHALARDADRVLLGPGGVLPWSVLEHGLTPAAAVARALGRPGPATAAAPVLVRDAVRTAVGAEVGEDPLRGAGVALHTVHVVLPVPAPPGGAPGAHWSGPGEVGEDPQRLPLVEDAAVAVGAGELVRLRGPQPAPDGPVVRQRLAAYAVVLDTTTGRPRLLLTRLSSATPSPGRWTLPGGGVDHGEHPVAAAVREVHEETGVDVDVDALVAVGSEHFTGRSPRGVLEDFHAVRVLVTATARAVREPVVLDVGGSTDLARWVDLDEVDGLGLVGVAQRGVQIARELADPAR